MPIPMQSKMLPANGLDFGLLEDTHLIGGFRAVKTKAEIDNLHSSKRRTGMLAYVYGLDIFYQLQDDLITWKEWQPGAMTAAKLSGLIQSLYRREKLQRVPGSQRAFRSTNRFIQEGAMVFLSRTLQFEGSDEDYQWGEMGNLTQITFNEDVEDGVYVSVVGWLYVQPDPVRAE